MKSCNLFKGKFVNYLVKSFVSEQRSVQILLSLRLEHDKYLMLYTCLIRFVSQMTEDLLGMSLPSFI